LQERKKKELEKGSVCDIREQEEEPYFNPELEHPSRDARPAGNNWLYLNLKQEN